MSTWRRHRAHRNIRASSIAAPGGEGWTIRNHRAILRSEPYASADLGAASDVTAKSIQSEAAPVSPAPAISPQRYSAVIAPAHGDGISGNIGSGGKHVPGGVAGTIQCVLGRPSQITSRPELHHLSALFGRREQALFASVRERVFAPRQITFSGAVPAPLRMRHTASTGARAGKCQVSSGSPPTPVPARARSRP